MGRRPQSPRNCANNQSASNKGDSQELRIYSQSRNLHPFECRSCARRNPHGGLFYPFHQQAISWPHDQEDYPCSRINRPWLRPEIHPHPKKSIRQDDIDNAIKRFDRDFYLKVFFTNNNNTSDNEEPIKKLRVTSKWMPDQSLFKITQRLGNFKGAMQWNFCPKREKSNLTKFQAWILQKIRSNKHIIITHADKNLGPVGIDTERYIRWALDKHLLDTNTYIQESKEEAWTAAFNLSRKFTCGRGNTKCAVTLPRMLLHTFHIGFRRITLILLGIFISL
jgi:hypothetical protein